MVAAGGLVVPGLAETFLLGKQGQGPVPPVGHAVAHCQGARRVENGGDISPGTLDGARPGTRATALDQDGRLVAILELRADRRLWPLRVLRG